MKSLRLAVFATIIASVWSVKGQEVDVRPAGGSSVSDWRLISSLGASGDEVSGEGRVFAPVFSDSDSVVYLQTVGGVAEGSAGSASLGLGFRQLVENFQVPFIAGAGVFYDFTDSQAENTFHQLGLHGEILTEHFDFRLNWYFPESSSYLTDSEAFTEVFQETETQRSIREEYGELYGQEHSILQNVRRIQRDEITTTTTEVTRYFERFEAAGEGYDTEMGVKLPIPDKFGEYRVFGGAYGYQTPFAKDLDGFKARFEARLSEHLIFDVAYHEDEEITGDNMFYGLRVSFPIGRKFSGNRSRPTRSALGLRLTEDIVRRSSSLIVASDFLENLERQQVNIDKETEVIEKLLSSRVIEILGDVIFVDESGGGRLGTAERPVSSLAFAQAIAEQRFQQTGRLQTVYVNGSTFRESVVSDLPGLKVQYVSSSVPIPGVGGKVFGGDGQRPLIFAANRLEPTFDVSDAGYFGLQGFQLDAGRTDVRVPIVNLTNVRRGVIEDITLIAGGSSPTTPFEVFANGNNRSSIVLRGIEQKSKRLGGFVTFEVEDSARLRLAIVNSTLGKLGEMFFGFSRDSSQLDLIIANNQIFNGPFQDGSQITAFDDSAAHLVIRDNVIGSTEAFNASNRSSQKLRFDFIDNQVAVGDSRLVSALADAGSGGVSLNFSGNEIGKAGTAIALRNRTGDASKFRINSDENNILRKRMTLFDVTGPISGFIEINGTRRSP